MEIDVFEDFPTVYCPVHPPTIAPLVNKIALIHESPYVADPRQLQSQQIVRKVTLTRQEALDAGKTNHAMYTSWPVGDAGRRGGRQDRTGIHLRDRHPAVEFEMSKYDLMLDGCQKVKKAPWAKGLDEAVRRSRTHNPSDSAVTKIE
ncbi:hypothetical protein G7046_g4095 [Stylonectria norvegica]|nr:hypothetical protein G7046_g4095 [Stylonectria norvegica]